MQTWIEDFRPSLDETAAFLKTIPADRLDRKMKADGWNMRQLLGHLIDSACNNHRRFTLAAMQDHLRFEGYAQEEWVKINDYDSRDWQDLIQLWHGFNLQICHLMGTYSAEKLDQPTTDHNLDQIAFRLVPTGEATSLGYFMRDYIGHYKHHLAQIQEITK
ncbi:MAG: DinB family protein [Bacteroidota bacterium]